jgi:hypothetical protein
VPDLRIIRQLTQSGGRRMPKLITYDTSYSDSGYHGGTGRRSVIGRWNAELNRIVYDDEKLVTGFGRRNNVKLPNQARDKVELGNLPSNCYRFWRGQNDKRWGDAFCKWCGHRAWTEAERERHKELGRDETHNCCQKLTELYKLLLAGRCCVSCGKPTHQQKWGVPLCLASGNCVENWLYGQPSAEVWGPVYQKVDEIYGPKERHAR